MSYPKIKPCPKCGRDEMAVFKYDNGWRHVECDASADCSYLGPGEGSILQAIKSHNAAVSSHERQEKSGG